MEIAVATWSCFRELEPGVKWILSDLLDIAAERGNCKESPEGERYLDGIPMEELCHTMIAALNVTKMKHYAAQVLPEIATSACGLLAMTNPGTCAVDGVRGNLQMCMALRERRCRRNRLVRFIGGLYRSFARRWHFCRPVREAAPSRARRIRGRGCLRRYAAGKRHSARAVR